MRETSSHVKEGGFNVVTDHCISWQIIGKDLVSYSDDMRYAVIVFVK